ncbi:MAG: rplY [Chlamydiales bacterium]|jgi:large subunit ribosomal protein L25|nr:rplY [Chlamydiales bacterium]
MELHVFTRSGNLKSENNTIRRSGNIPAVIYSKGEIGSVLSVSGKDFGAFMRSVEPGHLPTQIFTLVYEDGTRIRAIVKEIQYEPTSYRVIHLDFEQLHEDVKVKLKVPIVPVNVLECVGIKLGGVLRQVIRHMRVECLPKHIPHEFVLDVQELDMNDSKRLSDVAIPAEVRPLARLTEVAVVITKR